MIYLHSILDVSNDVKDKVRAVIRQYEALESAKNKQKNDLDLIKKMLRLSEDKPKHIYPMIAHRTLSYGLYATVYQPNQSWYNLIAANGRDTTDIRRALEYLQKSFSRMLAHAHYYTHALDCIKDATSYGYATLYLGADNGKLTFKRINPDEVVFSQDSNGDYSTVIRKISIPAWEMEHLFDKTPDEIRDQAKRNPFDPVTVYHAVYRREEKDIFHHDPKQLPYGSIYVLDHPATVLRVGEYRSNPLIVWTWSTRGDKTPTSPAWDALPAFQKLNSISDSLLKASQLSVEPPLNVPAEVMSKINWRPRALLPYYTNNRFTQPANVGINYPIGKEREDAMIQMIRQAFHVDFFLLMASLEGKGRLTATQVLEMQGEKAGILGAIISRMNKEFIEPMFDRLFELSIEQGWIDPSLADVKEIMEIDFQGILAQAQKRYSTVTTQMNALTQAIPIIQLNPEVADRVDWDKLFMKVLRESGLREEFFRPDKVVKAIRESRAQAQAKAQQIEQYKNYADAESKMSKARERAAGGTESAGGTQETPGILGGF